MILTPRKLRQGLLWVQDQPGLHSKALSQSSLNPNIKDLELEREGEEEEDDYSCWILMVHAINPSSEAGGLLQAQG